MASKGIALTLVYTAWDTGNNVGKTGDVANHTLRWIKDGTSAAPDNSPSEVDATNAPGVYKITLTAAECTCFYGQLVGKSATSNIVIMPVSVAFESLLPSDAADGVTFASLMKMVVASLAGETSIDNTNKVVSYRDQSNTAVVFNTTFGGAGASDSVPRGITNTVIQ